MTAPTIDRPQAELPEATSYRLIAARFLAFVALVSWPGLFLGGTIPTSPGENLIALLLVGAVGAVAMLAAVLLAPATRPLRTRALVFAMIAVGLALYFGRVIGPGWGFSVVIALGAVLVPTAAIGAWFTVRGFDRRAYIGLLFVLPALLAWYVYPPVWMWLLLAIAPAAAVLTGLLVQRRVGGSPTTPDTVPTPFNTLAIVSVVYGLCLSPAAIALGIFALVQVKRHDELGRGTAITGIVLGSIGVVVSLLYVSFFVYLRTVPLHW